MDKFYFSRILVISVIMEEAQNEEAVAFDKCKMSKHQTKVETLGMLTGQ